MNIEEIYGKYIKDSATTCWYPSSGGHISMVNYLNQLCSENSISKPDLFIFSDHWFNINDAGNAIYSAHGLGETYMLENYFEIKKVFKKIENIIISTEQIRGVETLKGFYNIYSEAQIEQQRIRIEKEKWVKDLGFDEGIANDLNLFENENKQEQEKIIVTQIHSKAQNRKNTAVLYKHKTLNFHLLLVASDNNQIERHPFLMSKIDYLVYHGGSGNYGFERTERNCKVLFLQDRFIDKNKDYSRKVIEMTEQNHITRMDFNYF